MNILTRLFLDPLAPTVERAPEAYRFRPGFKTWGVPVAIGVVLLLLSLVIGLAGEGYGLLARQFYFSYLVAYVFVLTISLGALFFVMIQHITRAAWSATVRRIPELLMVNFRLLAVLALPILIGGMHDLYHWTHHELFDPASPEYDPIIAGKEPYLNVTFFVIRIVLYFAAWIWLSSRLYRLSVMQDVEPRAETASELRRVSAYGIPLFGVTTAFASYDLLMSLDPHWFSTIFGVYFFAGCFFVVLATIVLFGLGFQRAGLSRDLITIEHYHDIGKYMFGFTVFWTYIAFSQYMLYWYGNLPEETIWFRHRVEDGWSALTWVLIIGHFIVPFFFLMPRFVKRTRVLLGAISVWFLVIHYIDLYWLAMPTMALVGEGAHHGPHLAALDLTTWFGMMALFLGLTLWRAGRHSLTPHHDAFFERGLAFENA